METTFYPHDEDTAGSVRADSEPSSAQAAVLTQETRLLSQPESNSNQNPRLEPVYLAFPFFAGLSLMFGIMFTFCLYHNPCGITYPVFTAFACFAGIAACKKLNVPIKKESFFLMGTAILLGISSCRTADGFLILTNGAALVLLGCVFALHQFYKDGAWNIGKYICSIFLYLCQAIGTVFTPFSHLNRYVKTQNNKLIRLLPILLLGIGAAIPVLAILIFLLSEADPVFSSVVTYMFGSFLNPLLITKLLLWTLFGTLSLYCLVLSCCLHKLPEEIPDRRKIHPAASVTGLSMIALIYLLFSVIQIVYLFLGRGHLPEGYTYSSYARQGFFQLLFVTFLNLVMVLCCLKYTRPHKALNLILTVICVCTYIMIASAAFRMMLYVREYHLSYLRLLVLWFLAMLTVLMAGVTWIIWNQKFPLFCFSLAVVSVFYVALAWARPDSVIAWDYVSHLKQDTVTHNDLFYLTRQLSADAAPAIASLGYDPEHLPDSPLWDEDFNQAAAVWLGSYYDFHCPPGYEHLGIRNYNFSFAQAKRLFPADFKSPAAH